LRWHSFIQSPHSIIQPEGQNNKKKSTIQPAGGRPTDRQTDRQRDRERERQRDRETRRQRDRDRDQDTTSTKTNTNLSFCNWFVGVVVVPVVIVFVAVIIIITRQGKEGVRYDYILTLSGAGICTSLGSSGN